MPLAIETHRTEERLTIFCKGHVQLGNEVEQLSSVLESFCIENKLIVLDLSAVDNLDVCNLAPLLRLAEENNTRGCKLGFAQFRGRVRQQLLCSQGIDRFSAI